jgi:predicted ATPase/DNA-binding CsgD family transcriptional regulator
MELLEREDYLVQLRRHFVQVENGVGHTVFLMGEAGIGKTSIVNIFEKEIKSNGCFYQGACDSLFTPRPLGPLHDMARHLGEHIADLLQKEKNRAHIFAAVVEQLSIFTNPSVLVFEDIHWADEATIDLIKYLARRISRVKCLLIVTCRDDEIHLTPSLRRMLGELPPDSFSRMTINPLSREAVNSLALSRGNISGADIYSLTGGNPFYVTEILVSGMHQIPEQIKDSILAVFHSRDVATQALLEFLSILPSRIDFGIVERIKNDFACDIDDCIWQGIIVRTPEYLSFKHELFRLAIEESLLPSKRKSFHKKMLTILFEIEDGSSRLSQLVHHAKHAGEKELIAQIAPRAAKEASIAGAHIEASKLYMIAIENIPVMNSQKAELYDSHARECYLINQAITAIDSQQKALDYWRSHKKQHKIGNALRFMSRLKWLQGKKNEVMEFALESIVELEHNHPTRELALSYCHLSQLYIIYNDPPKGLYWGQRALELAMRINDQNVLARALNNVGTVQLNHPSTQMDGEEKLAQSLSLALKNNWPEHIARAYSNCATAFVLTKNYSKALVAFENGLKYCEANDLTFLKSYMLSEKIKMLLDTGNWQEASKIASLLQTNESLPSLVRVAAITVLTRIHIRKGEFEKARSLIYESKKISNHTQEAHRIVPTLIAELELSWITNDPIPEQEIATAQRELFPNMNNCWYYSELAYWMNKCGVLKIEDRHIKFTKPFHLEIMGNWKAAAESWKELACPYEQALALFNGGQEHQKEALAILNDLGASATYSTLRSKLRINGVKEIPKGLRKSTRNNPACLTNRQIDVLNLLKEGLQNTEIARKLFISTKTVSHHISAILSQFEVNSRAKAVAEAKKKGIFR